jgi:hypothetical protein
VRVGQTLRVRVAFGLEQTFLDERAIQPFHLALDAPVHVGVAWLDGASGARASGPVRPTRGPTLALEGALAHATRETDRVRDGRRYRTWSFERDYVLERPGELVLAAPRLSFAWATTYADDLLRGRVPTDRVDAFALGEPLCVEVLPLPEEGRPPDFTGAIGSFAARVEAPAEVEVGRELPLVLEITGPGNHGAFGAPRLALDGFRVLGTTSESSAERTLFRYDLVATRADVRAVPAIELPFFDPGPPPAYRAARTAPLPITVRGGDPTAHASDARAAPADDGPWRPGPLELLAAVVAPFALVLLLLAARRARGGAKG